MTPTPAKAGNAASRSIFIIGGELDICMWDGDRTVTGTSVTTTTRQRLVEQDLHTDFLSEEKMREDMLQLAHLLNTVRRDPDRKRKIEAFLADLGLLHDDNYDGINGFDLNGAYNLMLLSTILHSAMDRPGAWLACPSKHHMQGLLSVLEDANELWDEAVKQDPYTKRQIDMWFREPEFQLVIFQHHDRPTLRHPLDRLRIFRGTDAGPDGFGTEYMVERTSGGFHPTAQEPSTTPYPPFSPPSSSRPPSSHLSILLAGYYLGIRAIHQERLQADGARSPVVNLLYKELLRMGKRLKCRIEYKPSGWKRRAPVELGPETRSKGKGKEKESEGKGEGKEMKEDEEGGGGHGDDGGEGGDEDEGDAWPDAEEDGAGPQDDVGCQTVTQKEGDLGAQTFDSGFDEDGSMNGEEEEVAVPSVEEGVALLLQLLDEPNYPMREGDFDPLPNVSTYFSDDRTDRLRERSDVQWTICTASSAALIRVQKDLAVLDLPSTMKINHPNPEDLLKFDLTTTPEEGMYKGVKIKFNVSITSNYPHDPPKVKCIQKIYHPNMDRDGNVCLDILGKDWTPVLDLNAVMVGLQSLVREANADNPITI